MKDILIVCKLYFYKADFKNTSRDFPGGAVVKNLPANAGAHGFEPWAAKTPHATEQLSPCATTAEPAL